MSNILNNIGFADADYKSIQMNEGNLFIYFKSWDEKEIKITFLDTIQFMYKLGDGVLGVFESKISNSFFVEALSRCYSEIPLNQPYKCYEIRDLYDFPFVTIVAREVTATKM